MLRDELVSRKFRFGRLDGSSISDQVTLNADGSIGGVRNANESSWAIDGGSLVFKNALGRPTTIFDTCQSDGKSYRFVGRFLPRGPFPWHTLTEKCASGIKVRKVDEFVGLLLRTPWRLSTESGALYTNDLRFLRNNRIGNCEELDAFGWRISGGALELFRKDGVLTARFEQAHDFSRNIRLTDGVRNLVIESINRNASGSTTSLEDNGPHERQLKVAVLVRAHVVNDKLYHLLDYLEVSRKFDTYVLADETRSLTLVNGTPVVSHSIDTCATLGLKTNPNNHANVLWLCGDYPLYCARNALPEYDYYIMIEFDVHLVRENPSFINDLILKLCPSDRPKVDFVGAKVGPCSPGWGMAVPALRRYEKAYYSGIFSFVVLSNSAIDFLMRERLTEASDPVADGELIHCEVFAVTALMNAGSFRCVGLQDLVPGCIGSTYHPGSPTLDMPNYLLGNRLEVDSRIELVHPVLDADDYLNRMWRNAQRCGLGAVEEFCEYVENIEASLCDEDIRLRYIALARDAIQMAR